MAFVPQQLGKYTLLRKIATGGMAEVFLARADGAAGFQKTLVIKRILPNLAEDEQFITMFLNEARVASQLNHPNVVSIYELGEEDGSYFIAMEHIDGPNLRALTRRANEGGRPIAMQLAAKIVSLACEGLQYAHDAVGRDGQPLNLIHRDISPDNILVSRQGAVKVVDFGIAKAANQPHLTKSGMLKGKLSYMPPEQIRGTGLDRRADVFAMGVVLHELLAGTKPFDSTSEVAVMRAILHEPPAPLRSVRPEADPDLEAIIAGALEKDREARYPSCDALQADLDEYLLRRGFSVSARDLAQLIAELMGPPAPLQLTPPPRTLDELPAVTATPARSRPGISRSGQSAAPVLEPSSASAPLARSGGRAVLLGLGALVIGGGAFLLGQSNKGAAPPPIITTVVAQPLPRPEPAVEKIAAPVAEKVAEVVPAKSAEPVAATPPEPHPAPSPSRHTEHHAKHVAAPKPSKVASAPAPAAMGKLKFWVLPFAEVEVDGKGYGQTPLTFAIASGKHHVVLTSGGQKKTLEVEVPPGGQFVVKAKFEAP